MDSKYRSLLKDTTLFGISSFGSKFITFLLVPLYTYVLSTKEYGIVDLITTTINLIYPILTLSMCDAVLRFAFDSDSPRNKVLSNALIFIAGSTSFLLLLTPLAYRIDTPVTNYWQYFVLIYVVTNLQICISNFVKSIGKMLLFAIQGIVYTFVCVICNIVFLLVMKIGVDGYLLSIVIAYVASIMVMLVFGDVCHYILHFSIDVRLMKEMIRYSTPLMFSTIAWWVNSSADKYMITALISVDSNGIYSMAHKIPTVLTTMTSIFSQAWQLSTISSEKEDASTKSVYYSNTFKYYSLFCVIATMLLIIGSQLIGKVLFAKEFYTAWRYVPVLLVASLFSAYAGFFAAAFTASKKTKILLTSTCIGAIANIVFNYILIIRIGAMGAAIGTMISFCVIWLARYNSTKQVVVVKIKKSRFILTHLLLITAALLFSFDITNKYIITPIISVFILILNWSSTRELLNKLLTAISSKLKKKRY